MAEEKKTIKKTTKTPKAPKTQATGEKFAATNATFTVGTRVNEEWYKRLEAVATTSRRKIAAVISICVEDHLPMLEKELGITVPGTAPKEKAKI